MIDALIAFLFSRGDATCSVAEALAAAGLTTVLMLAWTRAARPRD